MEILVKLKGTNPMKPLRYIVSLVAMALFAVVVDFALRPASVRAAAANPITVLCESCVVNPNPIPFVPVYLIVRDETTGEVWCYPRSVDYGNPLETGVAPALLGTLTPGKPISK